VFHCLVNTVGGPYTHSPAKGIITHAADGSPNEDYVWEIGDLNDMMALGMAAASATLVVAEKKCRDVLQRHRKRIRARVVTTVTQLPRTLIGLD